MPNQDKTGPLGQGSMTGRGLGPCGGRFGFRCWGRGFGFRQTPQLTKDQEKKILEAELSEIDAERNEIEKRLKELK
ncbi:MAG: DUF5320 domain-containing protein [archaeon]